MCIRDSLSTLNILSSLSMESAISSVGRQYMLTTYTLPSLSSVISTTTQYSSQSDGTLTTPTLSFRTTIAAHTFSLSRSPVTILPRHPYTRLPVLQPNKVPGERVYPHLHTFHSFLILQPRAEPHQRLAVRFLPSICRPFYPISASCRGPRFCTASRRQDVLCL